jgi:restriction system protein
MLSRPKRAHYQITELGRRYVDDPDGMRAEVDRRIAERESTRPKTDPSVPIASPQPPSIDPNAEQTPQEALYRAAESIRANLCDDILATILGKTPRAFEQLVAQLLQRMG